MSFEKWLYLVFNVLALANMIFFFSGGQKIEVLFLGILSLILAKLYEKDK
jgi:hypothetical protein